MKLLDAHCHLYKFSSLEIKRIFNKFDGNIIILSVSEDLESSIRNLTLSKIYENVIPAIGIHPWKINSTNEKDIEIIEKILKDEKIKILGEVGLDKKFVPESFDKQKIFFEKILNIAKEYDLSLNIHSPGAWEDTFNLLLKYDIKRAYFHWYSGDQKLLEEIQDKGYLIGINVSSIINKKYEEYIKIAKIENILTESDGPYSYKNIILHPDMLNDLYNLISQIKNVNIDYLSRQIMHNFTKLIY